MKIKRIGLIFYFIVASLILTGCWDNTEIDRKAFVSTIAVDVGEDVTKIDDLKNIKPTEVYYPDDLNMLRVTYGFPDIRTMEDGKASAPIVSITVDGYSMTDSYFKAIRQSSRSLHFGHSKLILLSDELFQYSDLVKEVMDYIEREPSLNRTVLMAVVRGKARDYVKMKPLMEENIDNYILGVMGNSIQNGAIYPVTLSKYIDDVKSSEVSMIPAFSFKNKRELNLDGMSIIENYEITEYLNNRQVTDMQILNGKVGACRKEVYKEGHPIDYNIKGVARKVEAQYKNDKLYLTYNIETEGSIKGYYTDANLLDTDLVSQLEGYFNDTMAVELMSTINLFKDDMKLDLIDAENIIKKYHPKIWNQVKNTWPDKYYTAKIKVNVKNHIRTVGLTN